MKPKTTTKSNLKNGNRNGRPALPENEKQSIIRPTKFNKEQVAGWLRIARALSGFSNNFNQFVRLCHIHGLEAMAAEAEFYLGKFRCLFGKFNND